jgi:hypothetical protein
VHRTMVKDQALMRNRHRALHQHWAPQPGTTLAPTAFESENRVALRSLVLDETRQQT